MSFDERIGFRLDEKLRKRIEKQADERELSRGTLVRQIVASGIKLVEDGHDPAKLDEIVGE